MINSTNRTKIIGQIDNLVVNPELLQENMVTEIIISKDCTNIFNKFADSFLDELGDIIHDDPRFRKKIIDIIRNSKDLKIKVTEKIKQRL